MRQKQLILFILIALISFAGVPVFADTPSSPSSTQAKAVNPIADQQEQADEISNLVKQSAVLYSQIADIADDTSTQATKKKMAQVDAVLNELKRNKEGVVRQMQREQKEKQEAENRAQQKQLREKAENLYDLGRGSFRLHNETTARIIFLRLENIYPNFRDTREYLSRIEADLKQKNVVAMTSFEKNEVKHLNESQAKQTQKQVVKAQQAKAKTENILEEQETSLKALAQKASEINDDIITFSRQQNYDAVKIKFTELKDIIASMTTLKIQMAKEKDRQERETQLLRDAQFRHDQLEQLQKLEDRQDFGYGQGNPLKGYPVVPPNPNPEASYYKGQEIREEQNKLFDEAVDLYGRQKYTQAKLLFGELADQHDRRAYVWLKKVDQAITKELLRSQEAEARERTAFLEDQLNAERELSIIQMRERLRQKALSEQFEHQKRILEDDNLSQIRKEELLKSQVHERLQQEAKHRQWERAKTQQQQIFHFRRIQAPPASAKLTSPPPAIAAKPLPAQALPMNTADLVKAHEDARQKHLEQMQEMKERRAELRAQRIAEHQARINAILEARAKIKEERQKERERQQALRLQEAQAKDQVKAMQAKHRRELQEDQDHQRAQKAKQEEITREEDALEAQFDRQEKNSQDQLEVQREAIHKQLEEGIEEMYQEAMSFYNQGDYAKAADRFKDIQDIVPGYKMTQQYMDDARQRSLNVPVSTAVPH